VGRPHMEPSNEGGVICSPHLEQLHQGFCELGCERLPRARLSCKHRVVVWAERGVVTDLHGEGQQHACVGGASAHAG
jgi:hypothetical protein